MRTFLGSVAAQCCLRVVLSGCAELSTFWLRTALPVSARIANAASVGTLCSVTVSVRTHRTRVCIGYSIACMLQPGRGMGALAPQQSGGTSYRVSRYEDNVRIRQAVCSARMCEFFMVRCGLWLVCARGAEGTCAPHAPNRHAPWLAVRATAVGSLTRRSR